MPFGLIGGAIAGAAGKFGKKLVRKGARWLAKQGGGGRGSVKKGAKRVLVRGAGAGAGAAGTGVVIRSTSRPPVSGPPPLPGRPPAMTRMAPAQGGGGRQIMAYPGAQADKLGRPLAAVLEYRTVAAPPPGYVAVTMPDGSRAAVLKGVARQMGLWKARPKPPVSAADAKAIRRAERAKKKVKRLAGNVGYTCRTKGSKR